MSTRPNVICNCCVRSYKSLSSINLMRAHANDASPEQDEGRTDRKKIRRRLSLLVSWSKHIRFLLYIALALNFSALAVTAADRYSGWLLEQPRSSERTLSFKQSVQLNNKIETLQLGFICDQRKNSKGVGAILIPFDGTFQSDKMCFRF